LSPKLRENCQDHEAMENNNPAEISFVEKRNKALEFISCHIAENCGNHSSFLVLLQNIVFQ